MKVGVCRLFAACVMFSIHWQGACVCVCLRREALETLAPFTTRFPSKHPHPAECRAVDSNHNGSSPRDPFKCESLNTPSGETHHSDKFASVQSHQECSVNCHGSSLGLKMTEKPCRFLHRVRFHVVNRSNGNFVMLSNHLCVIVFWGLFCSFSVERCLRVQ